MPSEFRSGRKKPVAVKKSFFVRYFVTTTMPKYETVEGEHNWRGDEETAVVVVLTVVVDAVRASQARRTALYILPVVATEHRIEVGELEFEVKPLEEHITELADLVPPLLEARRKLVTPEAKEDKDDDPEDDRGSTPGPESGPAPGTE